MNYLKSFQRKIILLVAGSLIIAAVLITAIGLRNTDSLRENDAGQIMSLLCTQNANKLDGIFRSTEQTVHILYDYTMKELERTDDIYNPSDTDSVIRHVRIMSYGAANNMDTAAAVYLRFDPDHFASSPGFFLTKSGDCFHDTPLTDLGAFDSTDISHVGWYYLPMESREPMWMEPYYNNNIQVYMISYVIPIFHEGTFIGIIGMDLDLDSLRDLINEETISPDSYAYLSDQDGELIY
ncbi:MAG: cache domain-containing protein, partial [Lachnospiraceae bacterium]